MSGGEGRIWLVCNVVGDGNYQEPTKCLCFPSVVEPHWFQCGSGSSILGHSGFRVFLIFMKDSKLEKPWALQKEYPALQSMQFLYFFLFLWIIFVLDPDPDPHSQSGSVSSRPNPTWLWIHADPDPDPQHWFFPSKSGHTEANRKVVPGLCPLYHRFFLAVVFWWSSEKYQVAFERLDRIWIRSDLVVLYL